MRIDLTTHPLFKSPLIRNRPLTHFLFWVSYVCFFALVSGGYEDEFGNAVIAEFIMLPVKMVAVYTGLYLLIPHFFLRGRYWLFVILTISMLVGLGMVQRGVVYFILYPIKYPNMNMEYGEFLYGYHIIKHVLTISYVLLFASAIKIVKYWSQDQQKAKALVQENLEAELKFLKAQIHPHFLFNTLNNLYSLTLQKSDHAPEVVLRLSGLVNYMLYDANGPHVSLAREIESIHNYIALEKIRYGQTLDVFFDVSGNISGTPIAPLLLLPFIENSFKHGVSDEIKDKWITANLNVTNEFLTFKVENACSSHTKSEMEKDYTGGIGLQNVQRRLELIYPGRYELKIREEPNSFLVILKIILE